MNLLAIEIDLDSFFDVNLIVFTTISFAFSVVIISFLVFAFNPLNKRARKAQGKSPEKISTMYIRLLIYGFAQFMAFVTDVFLVIFGHGYKLPWFTTTVFLTLMFYKLVFVLFKDFKDLGYNAKGITSTLKIAGNFAKDRDLNKLTETIEKVDMTKKDNNTKKSKISYKKNTIRSKMPFIILAVFLSISIGVYKYSTNFPTQVAVSNILTEKESLCAEHSTEKVGYFTEDVKFKYRNFCWVIEDVRFKTVLNK